MAAREREARLAGEVGRSIIVTDGRRARMREGGRSVPPRRLRLVCGRRGEPLHVTGAVLTIDGGHHPSKGMMSLWTTCPTPDAAEPT